MSKIDRSILADDRLSCFFLLRQDKIDNMGEVITQVRLAFLDRSDHMNQLFDARDLKDLIHCSGYDHDSTARCLDISGDLLYAGDKCRLDTCDLRKIKNSHLRRFFCVFHDSTKDGWGGMLIEDTYASDHEYAVCLRDE